MAAAMAFHDRVFLEEGSSKQHPDGVTSEEERTVRSIPSWRAMFVGATCIAFLVTFSTFVTAKHEQLEVPQESQHHDWEQWAMQSWVGPGSAHSKQPDDFQLADWDVSEVRTLHPASGTARNEAGADKSEEVQGIIQKWSEEVADEKTLKSLQYFEGSAKKKKGELDYFQIIFTHDWACEYFFSEKDKDAPLGLLLDSLLMHRHYKDELNFLKLPDKTKAYYVIKPRSKFVKPAQELMDKIEKSDD
jgi:hypothetical protein